MNFIIKKELLLENLNNVSKAISNKNIIPILGGVKLDLSEEGLYLTCSDNEITIRSFIEKKDIEKINNKGSIVIIGRYFIELIRKIPSDLIEIITDGLNLTISTINGEYNLNGMNPDEFPDKSLELSKNLIKIDKNVIKNIINQTSFAISNQESRPILTGINFKIKDRIIECVATDSYRLSKKIINIEEKIDEEVNLVIPGRNLIELSKIINEENEKIEMHIFSNNVLFKFDNIIFQSRLLNGNYPDTSKLIIIEPTLKIKVNTEDLYNAIDRASLLTSEKDKNVINMEIKDKEVVISSTSQEIGKIEERIIVEKDNNVLLNISYSSKYMMEALRTIKSEYTSILLSGEIKPIILKSTEEDNLIQLIVPIKTF